jgi:hypothetical protein
VSKFQPPLPKMSKIRFGIRFAALYSKHSIDAAMKPQVSISKNLMAQYDLANTVHGGMAQGGAKAWQDKDGFHLTLRTPGIPLDKIRIEAVNRRFVVYYMMEVLNGEVQLPHYLVNMPLLPIVDAERIAAKVEEGQIHIFAPFSDWAKGSRIEIALED